MKIKGASNIYDVVIVGSGRVGIRVAELLTPTKKRLALITCPRSSDTELFQLFCLFSTGSSPPPHVPPLSRIFHFSGPYIFESPHCIRVKDETILTRSVVLAVGCRPVSPSFEGLEAIGYRTPSDFIYRPILRGPFLIVGAGSLGVSLAGYLAKKKQKVILISRSHHILPREEPELAMALSNSLLLRGVRVETNVRHLRFKKEGESGFVTFIEREGAPGTSFWANELVLSLGYTPHTDGLNLNKIGVYVSPTGELAVKENMQTSVSSLYACGSVTRIRTSLLEEILQARIAAHNIQSWFLDKEKFTDEPLPFIIPTPVPLARIGLSEEEARRKRKRVRVTLFSLRHHERSLLEGAEGLIKIVGDPKTGEIYGVHVLSPHAEEIIQFAHLAMKAEIPLWDLTQEELYPPFTYGEAFLLAARKWLREASS